MVTPDSSVLVAGAESGHPLNQLARETLPGVREHGVLIAHTVAETYSTLTRSRFGRHPADVISYLRQFMMRDPVGLAAKAHLDAVTELATRGVRGASIFDGLIAIAAREAGLALVSLDARARRIYLLTGVEFELLQDR